MNGKKIEFDWVHFILSTFPLMGFAAFLTGIIDLEFAHSRTVGVKKVKWFIISHTIYLLLIVLLA